MKIEQIPKYIRVYAEHAYYAVGHPALYQGYPLRHVAFEGDYKYSAPFEGNQEYSIPVEMQAIEFFTIFPCTDGALVLGCNRTFEDSWSRLIASREDSVSIAPKTHQPMLQCLNRLLGGGPEALLEGVSFGWETEYQRTYKKEDTSFASFLTSLRTCGPCHINNSRHPRIPLWMMVFVMGRACDPPPPEALAHNHWERYYIEKNLGSLGGGLNLAHRFAALLEHSEREEEVQLFIEDHPELIAPDYRKCYPKFRLADAYVTDFVIYAHDAYEFVEIESPHKPIFTKSGQLHHLVTQAEDQILNWRTMIEHDHAFFERRLPRLYRPKFRLIYGRGRAVAQPLQEKLRTRFTDTIFETYDDVMERFEQTLTNLSRSY